MPLDCSKCNAVCCRHVTADFLKSDDGCCKWLDREKNICRIYDDRPLICNVDKYWEQKLRWKISYEEWIELQVDSCAELRAIYNELTKSSDSQSHIL